MATTQVDSKTQAPAATAHPVARGVASTHLLAAVRGEGARLWDKNGAEYLDFTSGIGVMNVGHSHPRIVAAATAQVQSLVHSAFQAVTYEPYIALASRLNALVGQSAPMKSALFTTGAEAIENSIKIARAYTGRQAVVAFNGAFHGRTMLALSLTASSVYYRQNFGPFASEVYHTPFPYEYRGGTTAAALASLKELFATRVAADRVAAIIIEPQLGEGGFIPVPFDFMKELRRITREHGIVFIADEIQSGFGRTGEMFGYQHSGVDPDLITMAKSLAAGFPLSAVVGRAEIVDAPGPGGLGGTYGGNPVSCAAALAVLDVFEQEQLVAGGRRIGEQLKAGLTTLQSRFPQIGDLRGLGAMLAIELVEDRAAKTPAASLASKIIERARHHGLLLLSCGLHKNVVRFLPPLVTTAAQVEKALGALEHALTDATA
jgi:4-aminobutyrate aminotransferase / (S)-3-amino-2-methylpropionate transaminase / 5-aminovalerate transaminase